MTLAPIGLLGILLAASLAGNGLLMNAYLGQRDAAIVAEGLRATAHAAAQSCSASVERAARAAKEQEEASKVEVKKAREEAAEAQQRARVLAAKPATRPGDDCGSAQDRIDAWMAERRK